jgi:Spermine/spermidine synthase domain
VNNSPSTAVAKSSETRFRSGLELFLISVLILFLELAAIRWFPSHALHLTFFTNVVLLACFLGMSVGCLAANRKRNYLLWTPVILGIAMTAAQIVEVTSGSFVKWDEGRPAPQVVFFGVTAHPPDILRYPIPVEVLCGFFFLLIALAMIGLGQELGRALNRWPNRVQAYTINISGSIAGILLFAACSWLQLSPVWWFGLVALALAYFYFAAPTTRIQTKKYVLVPALAALLALVVVLAGYTVVHSDFEGEREAQHIWSPYYRIDFKPYDLSLSVNLIFHQSMVTRNDKYAAYALPHILNRDAGRPPFRNVMIIGAGSGNDVSRALQWGAEHVDAVEIDPAIYRLGMQYHPDHPYQDPRVEIHNDDGRNFLRATNRRYDLIIYALVDSLVLHSGYSNIRLESYLFTQQTFADVKRHLTPGGTFVVYNYFRQGWLISRLQKSLEEIFGRGNPLCLTLPFRTVIQPEESTAGDFTVFFAGNTADLRSAFNQQPEYFLRADQAPTPNSPNGFQQPPPTERVKFEMASDADSQKSQWQKFGLATVLQPEGKLPPATDDWPFFYLRAPMMPSLSLRGILIMAGLALALIFWFVPRRAHVGAELTVRPARSLNVQMFFLGAGFMLIETKAVVTMALLFGSTWVVNSVVFFAVLVMILLANLWTLKTKVKNLWPYYIGLFVTLALNTIIPLDFFLGMNRALQVLGSCTLVFAPVLFAAVVFAASFKRTAQPDQAFGFNIAGAMLGGLAENSSMMLGFQYVVLVAILFYVISALGFFKSRSPALVKSGDASPVPAESS